MPREDGYDTEVLKYKKDGMQRVSGMMNKTRVLSHFHDYQCEKPKTEEELTDEAAMKRWLKRQEGCVRWLGERWMGTMRSLLHVSPIEATKPMLLANLDYYDDPCSPEVEACIQSMWETIKVAHSGRHGHLPPSDKNQRCMTTLLKIQRMLQALDSVRGDVERPDMVELAIWFHDIVYDTTLPRGESEARSAAALVQFGEDVATELAKAGNTLHVDHALGRLAIRQLEAWILETQRHFSATLAPWAATAAPVKDFEYFLDLDVMVLALPPAEYEAYARDVRREYQNLRMTTYRENRIKVLEQMQGVELFRTEAFRAKGTDQAHRNIEWELERLRSGKFPTDPMEDLSDVDRKHRLDAMLDTDHDGKISRSEFEAMHGAQFEADVCVAYKEQLPAGWVRVPKRGGAGTGEYEYVNTETKKRQNYPPTPQDTHEGADLFKAYAHDASSHGRRT